MNISDEEIRQRLKSGEDSKWEFKRFEFRGNKPTNPNRNNLADEMVAFANADGGKLLCGVMDDGQIQGLSPKQLTAVGKLLVEIGRDSINPTLDISTHICELDGKGFLLVEIPKGDTVHDRDGKVFLRSGETKRRLNIEEVLRIARYRGQARSQYAWFDNETVGDTGYETLNERLWESLLSVTGADDPRQGLTNLHLLAEDEHGVERATVAGVLFGTDKPQIWLPQAEILATHYRGYDRASGQLDAQEITGPLGLQIADAMKFVVRNMRVAARKIPARENMPQYSTTAVFESLVNAVAHRDYSMSSRRIRLSMFQDRIEIDSPGPLPNGMTIEGMQAGPTTRNEIIARVFGRFPVGEIPGSEHRLYIMERRGDGVPLIFRSTYETSGKYPMYEVIDNFSLKLTIPAAKLEIVPANATIAVHSDQVPLEGVEVVAFFPNKTHLKGITDYNGEVVLDLYTKTLPMTVFAAAPKYSAGIERNWLPTSSGLLLELKSLSSGGSTIFDESTGKIPGLHGFLNPKRDSSDRTYLYANNIAIEDGRPQPVPFRFGKALKLTDSFGYELMVSIIDMIGNSTLLEYQELSS